MNDEKNGCLQVVQGLLWGKAVVRRRDALHETYGSDNSHFGNSPHYFYVINKHTDKYYLQLQIIQGNKFLRRYNNIS